MWATIMRDRFGATNPKAMALRFHAQTGGSTLTAQQPENNIVRVAIQALSAIAGGAQSLHTNGFDEALALPTERSARIALRTQQILAAEAGATDTADPLGGSYFIEELTAELEEQARELIERIDEMGGAVAAVEQGFVQREIEEAAFRWNEQVESGERVIVGVNRFVEDDKEDVELLRIDPDAERRQLERTARVRAERNAEEAEAALTEVRRVAAGPENLLPPMREALRARVTIGEISNALRDEFGTFDAAGVVSPLGNRKFPSPQPMRARGSQTMRPSTRGGIGMRMKTVFAVLLACGVVTAAAVAAGGTITGPSSSVSPYVIPAKDGVITKSILTVGDSVDGYRMVGIPDGLGAYESRPGTFTLLSNHEIATQWAPRATRRDRRVRLEVGDRTAQPACRGGTRPDQQDRDLEHRHELVQPACEGHLARPALLGRPRRPLGGLRLASGLGYNGPLFLDGEEVGNEGRAFAHAEGGISWELPSLGKYSFENAVANPSTGRATVVVGTDDTSPLGQVYVYVGEKKATGNPAERAGLTGGTLYGIKVPGTPSEPTNTGIPSGTAFTAANLGNVANKTGAQLQATASRPE